jgi:hypothetical protein
MWVIKLTWSVFSVFLLVNTDEVLSLSNNKQKVGPVVWLRTLAPQAFHYAQVPVPNYRNGTEYNYEAAIARLTVPAV